MDRIFAVIDQITREYKYFNTVETQLTLPLLPAPEGDERDPVSHFMASVTNLCEHAYKSATIRTKQKYRFETNLI
jgi:hypothetical protein